MNAAIEIDGLRKRFGPVQALDGMTFTVQPGHVRLTALPPNLCAPVEVARGKCAMIWSATITEIPIVISACRRSWPWFQRRSVCWVTSPTTAMQPAATSIGSTHSQVLTSAEITVNPLPVMACWIS